MSSGKRLSALFLLSTALTFPAAAFAQSTGAEGAASDRGRGAGRRAASGHQARRTITVPGDVAVRGTAGYLHSRRHYRRDGPPHGRRDPRFAAGRHRARHGDHRTDGRRRYCGSFGSHDRSLAAGRPCLRARPWRSLFAGAAQRPPAPLAPAIKPCGAARHLSDQRCRVEPCAEDLLGQLPGRIRWRGSQSDDARNPDRKLPDHQRIAIGRYGNDLWARLHLFRRRLGLDRLRPRPPRHRQLRRPARLFRQRRAYLGRRRRHSGYPERHQRSQSVPAAKDRGLARQLFGRRHRRYERSTFSPMAASA